MLLRTASHGVTPAVLNLDFLIPRTILYQNISRTIHSASQFHNHIHTRPHEGTPQRFASSSSNPATLSPGAVLNRLDDELGIFDKQALSSLTNAQVEAFNSVIPDLRVAFAQHDIPKVWETWSLLRKRNLLAFFGPAQYDVCSRSVAGFCKRTLAGQLAEENARVLSDIALVCAAGGSTAGLKALMLFTIKEGKPRATLELYDLYLNHLQEKGVLTRKVGRLEAASEEEEMAPLTPSPIRDEILFAAIVAHAQLGSFADALQVYLLAGTRIAPTTLEDFNRILHSNHTLRTTVNLYARRLNTAALLACPPMLMKHLSNLTRDSADMSLERLYTTAIAGIRDADPWVALTPDQLGGERVVLLPYFFWASFLKCFLACRRTDLAERLWDDILGLGVKPDLATWNASLDGYGNMRSLEAVLNLWESMRIQNIKPDALSYRAVISAFFAAGKVDDALQWFQTFEREFPKTGASLEDSGVLTLYNTVLQGLLFVSREEESHELKKKMETNGPKPDIATYNTFLRYYGRKGDLKTMAQVLQQLEPAGVTADVYTFSTLLSAMGKVRPDAGQIVINFMTKQGVVPDTTTLTSVINHQLRECTPRNFKIAMDLLSNMERGEFGDIQPSTITYTSILTAINRGSWLERQVVEETNKRIWDTMQSKDLHPNRATYNVLLRAALKGDEPEGLENAMKYYRDMLRQRVHVGTDTWYILLKGLMDREQWEVAGEVVRDMRQYKATITGSLRTLVDRFRAIVKRNESRGAY
ncbi:hypothetical protein C8Q79DRAFT_1081204 [Trametes meyenii]|nr:hypothetical protein C8Q79DRAFT_1081204 [Trametes meyenii]